MPQSKKMEEDEKRLSILIDICSAWNLPNAVKVTMLDPYVNVYHVASGKKIHNTDPISNSSDPIWTVLSKSLVWVHMSRAELFQTSDRFNKNGDDDLKDGLMFEVKDYDTIGKNPLIGVVFISAKNLIKYSTKQPNERISFSIDTGRGNVSKKAMRRFTRIMSKKVLAFGDDYVVPTLALRFRSATEKDEAFMDKYNAGTHTIHNLFKELEKSQNFKSSLKSIFSGDRMKKLDKDTGEKLLKVLPGPDPENVAETEWMTKSNLKKIALNPSRNWIEVGSGDIGYLFVEIIGCDGLDKKDTLGKSDPFVCLVFEDAVVTTDVIDKTLHPRWMPWSKRAFVFRADYPNSILYLGVFDSDVGGVNDFIGHIKIKTSKFLAGTEYLLHYKLFQSKNKYGNILNPEPSTGQVTIRIRSEYSSKAFLKSLTLSRTFFINATNSSASKIIDQTCEGCSVASKHYDQSVLFGCLEMLSNIASRSFILLRGLKNIILWRGDFILCIPKWDKKEGKETAPLLSTTSTSGNSLSYATIKVWFPINSLILFIWAVMLVEHPFLMPAFISFILPWLLFNNYFSRRQHPSPWRQPRPLRELILHAFGRKLPQNIPPNQNKKQIEDFEKHQKEEDEAWKKEVIQSYEYSKQAFEMQVIADQFAPKDDVEMTTQRKFSLNPLDSLLFPYQEILCVIVELIQLVINIFTWESPYTCFSLSLVGIVLSMMLMFVSPLLPIFTLWVNRLFVWVLFGPWMKLVDIIFIQPNDNLSADERMKKSLAEHSNFLRSAFANRQILKEDKMKLKDMLSYRFGKHIVSVPSPIKCMTDANPLPSSSSSECDESIRVCSLKRQLGQYLEGHMIHSQIQYGDPDGKLSSLLRVNPFNEKIDTKMDELDMTPVQGGTFRLKLEGSKLKNTDGIFSKPDPFFELIVTSNVSDELDNKCIYRSELVKNTLNPDWKAAMLKANDLFKGNVKRNLLINVYDHESSGKHTLIGSTSATIDSLVAAQVRNQDDVSKALQLTKFGDSKSRGSLIVIMADFLPPHLHSTECLVSLSENQTRISSSNSLSFQIVGYKLKNIEGPFQKSDPFYELHAWDESAESFDIFVYRSDWISNNLNPQWDSTLIDTNILFKNNANAMFRISVYDHESDGKHDLIGVKDTSLNEIISAQVENPCDSSKALYISKKRKNTGKLIVVNAKVSNSSMVKGFQAILPDQSITGGDCETHSPIIYVTEKGNNEDPRDQEEIADIGIAPPKIMTGDVLNSHAPILPNEPNGLIQTIDDWSKISDDTEGANQSTKVSTMDVISTSGMNSQQKSFGAGKLLHLHLIGYKLKNIEGPFQKSDPFFELHSLDKHGKSTQKLIYRSDYIPNNLNPWWEPVAVDVDELCEGNTDKLFRIVIFDHESDGEHDIMGDVDITIDQLLSAKVHLQKNDKIKEQDMSKAIHISRKNKRNKSLGRLFVIDSGTQLR